MSDRTPEMVNVVLVEFGYYEEMDLETEHFWVPDDLLWSAEGLAQIFEVTRIAYFGTRQVDEAAWDSWHLIAVHDDDEESEVCNRIVVNVDWISRPEEVKEP